jgi:hypothetical protein
VLGKKQGKYDAVDGALMNRCGFAITDIVDFSDICAKIVSLKFDDLFLLYQLFEKELQVVVTEFEIPNRNGDYKTSLSAKLETVPNSVCQNAKKFLVKYSSNNLPGIIKEFKKLRKLPRVTREFLKIIITIGRPEDGNYKILFSELRRKLRMPETDIHEEIQILVQYDYLFGMDEEAEVRTRFSDTLMDVIEFGKEEDCLQKLIVPLDFTLLDT